MVYKGKDITDGELLVLFDEMIDELYPHPWIGKEYLPSRVLKAVDSREYALRYRQWLATMQHAGVLEFKCDEDNPLT